MMNVAYFNGEFMPLEDVRVSPLDRGYLYGVWHRVDELLQGLKRSLTA